MKRFGALALLLVMVLTATVEARARLVDPVAPGVPADAAPMRDAASESPA